MGKQATAAFTRLYMVPGMQHCAGGPGPTDFGQNGPSEREDPQHDIELALHQWVKKRIAPTSIIATKYVEDDPKKGIKMTRPLCPFPQTAAWVGKGSTDDSANFVCKDP
jgi:Tannase and feruloyl esterase